MKKQTLLATLFSVLILLLIATGITNDPNKSVFLAPQQHDLYVDGTSEASQGSSGSGGPYSCTTSYWFDDPRCSEETGNLERKLHQGSLDCPLVEDNPLDDPFTGYIIAPDEDGCYCISSISWEEWQQCDNGCEEDTGGIGSCSPGSQGGECSNAALVRESETTTFNLNEEIYEVKISSVQSFPCKMIFDVNGELTYSLSQGQSYVLNDGTFLDVSVMSCSDDGTSTALVILDACSQGTECTSNSDCNTDFICNSQGNCVLGPSDLYSRVFVTAGAYQGDLGGLDEADAKCQSHAFGLGGTWKAWLSDSETSASERLYHSQIPYKRLDGLTIANDWNDLIDSSLQNPINLNEIGELGRINWDGVWTGTSSNGDSKSPYCEDWTTLSELDAGSQGDKIRIDSRWTQVPGPLNCNDPNYLYCFEQPSGGEDQCTPPPSGLVSWWSAEDINGEQSPNDLWDSNNPSSASFVYTSSGKVGNAFLFNSNDHKITIPTSSSLNFGANEDFTLEAWIKMGEQNDEPRHIAGKRAEDDSGGWYRLFTRHGGKIVFEIAGTQVYDIETDNDYDDNEWHHITGIRRTSAGNTDTIELRIDYNAETKTKLFPDDTWQNNNAPFTIGKWSPENSFNGLIDELSIYNTALSQQQIQAIYEANTAGKCRNNIPLCTDSDDLNYPPGTDAPSEQSLLIKGIATKGETEWKDNCIPDTSKIREIICNSGNQLQDVLTDCPNGHSCVWEEFSELDEQLVGVCRPSEICGNFIIEEDEECDDGNDLSGDGCNADCSEVEQGYICQGQPSDCRLQGSFSIDFLESGCIQSGSALKVVIGVNNKGHEDLTESDFTTKEVIGPSGSTYTINSEHTGTNFLPIAPLATGILETKCNNIFSGGCETGSNTINLATSVDEDSIQVTCPVLCGDGVIEDDEKCDDGNTQDGDGCDRNCDFEGTHTLISSCDFSDWESNVNYYLSNDISAEITCLSIPSSVENIKINCLGRKITANTKRGIEVSADDTTIKNCIIEAGTTGIIVDDNVNKIIATNNDITALSDGDGIVLQNDGSGSQIINNKIVREFERETGFALRLTSQPENTMIKDNDFCFAPSGIRITGTDPQSSSSGNNKCDIGQCSHEAGANSNVCSVEGNCDSACPLAPCEDFICDSEDGECTPSNLEECTAAGCFSYVLTDCSNFDSDTDGDVDSADQNNFWACWSDPDPLQPGCEWADSNNDGIVGEYDSGAFNNCQVQSGSGVPYPYEVYCTDEGPSCGNGLLDSGEECDDGGFLLGDGCGPTCLVEFCGDNICNEGCDLCVDDCGECAPECPDPCPRVDYDGDGDIDTTDWGFFVDHNPSSGCFEPIDACYAYDLDCNTAVNDNDQEIFLECCAAGCVANSQGPAGETLQEDEIIVTFSPDVSETEATQILESNDLGWSNSPTLSDGRVTGKVKTSNPIKDTERLLSSPEVEKVTSVISPSTLSTTPKIIPWLIGLVFLTTIAIIIVITLIVREKKT